jgi:uncharacterized membrane protein YfcA
VTEALILCAFAFLAGLVDAVAGGGGLIQVPALFAVFPAAPPALLLGTNKVSSIAGTASATMRYCWSVPIPWRLIVPAAVLAAAGACAGACVAITIDEEIFRPIVVVLLTAVALHVFFRRSFGLQSQARLKRHFPQLGLGMLALVIGFYDGLLGPGAGSLLMYGLVRFFGYDFLGAAASTKVLNLATNFGALAVFAQSGNILYAVALPMAAANVAGGALGAHLAIRGGSRLIRRVFVVVVIALMVKVAFDLVA